MQTIYENLVSLGYNRNIGCIQYIDEVTITDKLHQLLFVLLSCQALLHLGITQNNTYIITFD